MPTDTVYASTSGKYHSYHGYEAGVGWGYNAYIAPSKFSTERQAGYTYGYYSFYSTALEDGTIPATASVSSATFYTYVSVAGPASSVYDATANPISGGPSYSTVINNTGPESPTGAWSTGITTVVQNWISNSDTTPGIWVVPDGATQTIGVLYDHSQTAYVYISVTYTVPPPTANFQWRADGGTYVTSGTIWLASTKGTTDDVKLDFQDLSSGATSWLWQYRFNGGTWTNFPSGATTQSPQDVTFSNGAGIYDVRLQATNSGGNNTKTVDVAFIVDWTYRERYDTRRPTRTAIMRAVR